jgi:F-type H+-transporting ATPase subunit a
MFLALILLVVLMIKIANKYKRGDGVSSAPKGWQNAIEPVITFVRDEVAKPNLAGKYQRGMSGYTFSYVCLNRKIQTLAGGHRLIH